MPRKKKEDTPIPAEEAIEVGDDLEEIEELPGGVVHTRPKSKRGRPVYKYNPQYPRVVKAMLTRGGTTSELASVFGISERTLWKWRAMYPEFNEAFVELGQNFCERIEVSLAQRAIGYYYPVKKPVVVKGKVVIVEYEDYMHADTSAAKHYLSIKRPEEWRVREELEVSADAAFAEIFRKMGQKGE